MKFRVGTYNIHKESSFDMKANLEKLNLDVIFIQEVRGNDGKNEAQFEFLADQLWPYYAYGKNAIHRSGKNHGNAILSKLPFFSWENIDVSPIKRASRSILHGQIRMPNFSKTIHFICVHFGFFEFERRKQVATLCDRIASHVGPEDPLIVAGDFNDWRRQVNKLFEHRLHLVEVFEALTGGHAKSFPSFFPILPLDRIYFRGFKPVQALDLNFYPWRKLSDHIPLVAELEIE